MLKGSSSTFQHAAARATTAAAVVVRPSSIMPSSPDSCLRLKALQALPLQALHLAHTKPVHLRRMACLFGPADTHLEWWSHQQQV